ncbi:MAG: methyltransferase domain-containing protein [Bryobacteraceae bacterium]|nr:methyltransferase domain-containing protein [Bryobacteraceae bacterium]
MKQFLTALFLFVSSVLAQGIHPVSGRAIAPVMGMGGADWLERPERVKEENPDLAVKLLDIKAGMTIADIGAGVGYYSEKLARLTGPSGRVYATEIQPGMLARLKKRMEAAGVSNYEPVLARPGETGLPDNAIDLALLVDVYHEFDRPQQMLAAIRRSLKPTGRLVLLEFRKEDAWIPIREEHKMSVAEAKKELEAEGFRLQRAISDRLPWQHILIFQKAVQ